MTKQLFFAMGCLALLALFTSAAMADAITFTFAHDPTGNSVSVSATQLTFSQPDDVTVQDSTSGPMSIGPNARAGIQSSNGTYSTTPLVVTATYLGGPSGVTEVSVTGGVGGICGVCLQGVTNAGTYTGFKNTTGVFEGNFHVTFISPAILALFGDGGQHVSPLGTDSFTSDFNHIGPTSTSAVLGSASITIETTPVPEPASLALLGTAILGVAGGIRRKR